MKNRGGKGGEPSEPLQKYQKCRGVKKRFMAWDGLGADSPIKKGEE